MLSLFRNEYLEIQQPHASAEKIHPEAFITREGQVSFRELAMSIGHHLPVCRVCYDIHQLHMQEVQQLGKTIICL